MPPAPVSPSQGREEIALMNYAGLFAQACLQYVVARGYKLDAANLARLADPPDANKNDPDVIEYQTFKGSFLLRETRLGASWAAMIIGNVVYLTTPPDFGGDAGPGKPVPTSAEDLLDALQMLATTQTPALVAAISKPKYAPMVAALKAFLGGASITSALPSP